MMHLQDDVTHDKMKETAVNLRGEMWGSLLENKEFLKTCISKHISPQVE